MPTPLHGIVLFLALLSGHVLERGSLEPIPFATISVTELGATAVASSDGSFALSLPPGTWILRVEAPGFESREDTVVMTGVDLERDLLLTPAPFGLEPIHVGGAVRGAAGIPGPPVVRLAASELRSAPFVGESDVFRSMQSVPGIAEASDYSTAFYVRGGTPDQNLILLDGIPLFNPFHLGGMFSAIDPDAIAAVAVTPGGFAADQGDRLSSVVELWTRNGGRDRVRGHGSLGIASFRGGLGGPLPGERGSFFVSYRRTYLDLLSRVAVKLGVIWQPLPYGFSDFHAKLTQDVGGRGQVTASYYRNREGVSGRAFLGVSGRTDLAWGSDLLSAEYRHLFRGGAEVRVRAGRSSFDSEGTVGRHLDQDPALTGSGRFVDRTASVAGEIPLGDHRLLAGTQLDAYENRYDVTTLDAELARFVPSVDAAGDMITTALFIEDRWTPRGPVSARAGLRLVRSDSSAWIPLPRFGASLALSDRLTAHVAAGGLAQFVSSMRNEEAVFSSLLAHDLLRPAGEPAHGWDAIVGLQMAEGALLARVDVYEKRLRGLSVPGIPDDPLTAPVLVAAPGRDATMRTRGLEATLGMTAGRFGAQVGYNLGWSRVELDSVAFVPRYHRRHTLDAGLTAGFGTDGLLSARLVAASGQPSTPVVGVHFPVVPFPGAWGAPHEAVVLGRHNSARLPGYLRLDAGVRGAAGIRAFGRDVTLRPFLQVINLLSVGNVMWAEPQVINSRPRFDFAPQLPILPTIGVEWRF